MGIFAGGTTVETTNLQLGDILDLDFTFYHVILVCGFTEILTVVCANTRILWIFPTASKLSPVRIICFVQKKLNNEKHPYKRMIVDEYDALGKTTEVTDIFVC